MANAGVAIAGYGSTTVASGASATLGTYTRSTGQVFTPLVFVRNPPAGCIYGNFGDVTLTSTQVSYFMKNTAGSPATQMSAVC